ncbi:MAG: ATP-binding protein [Bacteroidota bacterium]
MRTPTNPFLLSGYHSPAYFCNREKELEWLLDQFENERNAVLYAYRRIGKTALIKHLFYHLEKDKKTQTVFVDLLGTASLEEANKKIASAIIYKFGNFKEGIGKKMLALIGSVGAKISIDPMTNLPEVSFGLMKEPDITKSMEALGHFLKSLKSKVIIAIDEFQQIANYSNKNSEAIFRSWTQEFPMIRFVFSGSHRHMIQAMFTDQKRPFYSSAQLTSLESLDAEVYAAFIQSFFKKEKKEISEETIQDIFSWCRMQTYYIQLTCNKLYGSHKKITKELLIDTKHDILQQEAPVFSTYQQLFTEFQWKLLKAIALEQEIQSPNSKEFVSKHQLGAASSVSTALKTLVNKEFVVFDKDHYRIHDTLFMRWLQQV